MQGVRRVVVTGIGLVTPLGVGAPNSWMNLTAGKIGTKPLVDQSFSQVTNILLIKFLNKLISS